MAETSIEWTDHSVNPIRMCSPNGKSGHYCEKVSPGCKNCYSSRFQPRVGLPQFQEQRGNTDGLFLDASKLEEVIRRKKPTKWFWCDMTDMFGDWVPFEWIAACFGVMAATPWHTHQVLTKRPKRALEFFEWVSNEFRNLDADVGEVVPETSSKEGSGCLLLAARQSGGELKKQMKQFYRHCETSPWPLPNVWLGVSAEDQKTADERIPLLLQCPAAVRFVSAEPLLGPVLLNPISRCGDCGEPISFCIGAYGPIPMGHRGCDESKSQFGCSKKLDWIIVGGESGPGARRCNVEWIRSIVRQCGEAGVACFVKQLGAKPTYPAREFPNGHLLINNKKGSDMSEWPEDLRVRQFPEVPRG